ncbi:MAG: Mrp/NBP35 family ATP-binding protein [Candidatus Methanomethylophilus sp.]|nr:Mrp/NBP35 family ATP-binding protein [Methanomethylophilus sp.]MBO5599696.1 Mrp/NBP35 family ATP-binding protein [Methanomethylophilus sp.]MBQ5483839.1 Mrp/NBP35 family ATP-binding protein [Methanomethylophilus sp.]
MSKPMFTGEEIEEETRRLRTLENIKHVIIVISGKGGVGKSTVSANIAETLSMQGYQTGIMDVDITGPNIPKMFHVEDEKLSVDDNRLLVPVDVPPSLKLVSMAFLLPSKDSALTWRGPVRSSAVQQFIEDVNWGPLDYLIIDMPPGTGDEALSIIQLIPKADGTVIVTTPQEVSLLDARKTVTFSSIANIPIIGIVENMSGFVCPHCGEVTNIFKSGGGEDAANQLGIQFLGRIPLEAGVVNSGDKGMPVVIAEPDSASAKAFKSVVAKIVDTIENHPEVLKAQKKDMSK